MQVKVWGTRGSRPVSGQSVYGNETSCVEVRTDSGDVILLDAGSGLSSFVRANPDDRPVICLSHLHLDHVQGLPFYAGLFDRNQTIYAPARKLDALFNGVLSPIPWQTVAARIREVDSGASFRIGSALVETAATDHAGGCLAWKITADDWTFVYSGDHEISLQGPAGQNHENLMRFMTGADLVLVDGHFSRADHASHVGWGHSDMGQWPAALAGRNIGRIVFTHFNPDYTDQQIRSLLEATQKAWPDLKMDAAYAGCVIDAGGIRNRIAGQACQICEFFKSTATLYDTHAVLNALLTKARQLGKADAGTVYLLEGDELIFAAAQNDTLFPKSAANKFSYMNSRIPVNRASIAGYVAATGASLNIPDVYELVGNEYGFNRSFDDKSGYRTGSMLVVPLLNGKNRIVGVVQLINSQGENGFTPFTSDMEKEIRELAAMSTVPLERAFMITGMIERMLKTSALRDPSETAGHVYRVGSLAAELYHQWAEARNVEPEELLSTKGRLRLAAMLHDVGKVGIPDAILKKPGRLDDAERARMQEHACLGARLFDDGSGEIDEMARDIAMHHHAKWDGSGYTGDPELPSPAGEAIPIWARIVAIADVYDALVSSRCYKEGWKPEKALEILRKDAGSHFDPELVGHFCQITDTVNAIMQRYSN